MNHEATPAREFPPDMERDLLLPLKRRIHEVFGVPKAALGLPEPKVVGHPEPELICAPRDPYSPGQHATFEEALRGLVEGIDVQGDEGTWTIDREALDHARRVLGIEGEGAP